MNENSKKLMQLIIEEKAKKKAKKKDNLDKLIEKAERADTVKKLRDVVVEMMREVG